MDQKTKGKLGLILLAVMLILTMAAGLLDTLIDENIFVAVSLISLVISVPVIIITIQKLRSGGLNDYAKKHSWVTYIGLIFFTPLLFAYPFAVGAPAALHMFLASKGELVVTVDSKGSSFRSRRVCSGRVYLKEYKYMMNDSICGIREIDWNTLKPGDKIKLYGSSSQVGFKYTKYEKLVSVNTSSMFKCNGLDFKFPVSCSENK
jgi:hypothetical protein